MPQTHRPTPEEVEHLLLNAQLRDELEPYLDEAVDSIDFRQMPTPKENEFLASMLAWERAPVLPISQWFAPELVLPHPDKLSDEQVSVYLTETIRRLHEKRILLDYSDHLSDRALYHLIWHDILPAREKKVDLPKNFLHWSCLDAADDPETWLRFYASEEERDEWADETGLPLPPSEPPPHPRKLPRRPL